MKKATLLTLALLQVLFCSAQFLNIPAGTKPTIDGVILTNEWDDAGQTTIYVQTGWEVLVFYKHSDTSLFFAFTDIKGVFGDRYPDVMLDINNDKDTTWQMDDWWLHASYNDCEGNGEYNVWTSCVPTHPGWSANNYPMADPGIIEMEITYQKIGLAPGSGDTIGIAFEVSDTFTDYKYFPSTATIEDPSTWTNGILSAFSALHENPAQKINIEVFPNPSNTFITFSFPNPDQEEYTFSIYSPSGQTIQTIENVMEDRVKLDTRALTSGLYFFTLMNQFGKCGTGKFIIK